MLRIAYHSQMYRTVDPLVMTTSEGFGERLATRLRAEEARTIVTRILRTADMAVTETRCDDPIPGLSHPIQREDAYLVALTLRDFPNRKYWQDGRQNAGM